ncbi:M23 family metallopeptidase [Aquimarina algiphila]|uniref:M23 family metallopeptidase n=1 Tax=Aquimarina algiphila TaxID=2047982 RepID=UPI002330AAAD|nr:M23 family metallopeptidase [Aquimarina algiphila]
MYFRYTHVQSASVKVGQRVSSGDPIGLSGVSGNASGTRAPHLHFEITNDPAPPKGLNYKYNPAFYVNNVSST